MMTHQIQYGDMLLKFELNSVPELEGKIRIKVHPKKRIEVQAPTGTCETDVREALKKRLRWVVRNLETQEAQRCHILPRQYVSGETHFYLGRRYVLKVTSNNESSVKLKGSQIIVCIDDRVSVPDVLNRWYRKRAKTYFKKRLVLMMKDLPWVLSEPKILLRPMTTQWGSCSPSGDIILNPKLIKASIQCIDYVLLHELCHLVERNHSARFYNLLSIHQPDWKMRRASLNRISEVILES
jgi:predicted metal-dependent hydrolase